IRLVRAFLLFVGQSIFPKQLTGVQVETKETAPMLGSDGWGHKDAMAMHHGRGVPGFGQGSAPAHVVFPAPFQGQFARLRDAAAGEVAAPRGPLGVQPNRAHEEEGEGEEAGRFHARKIGEGRGPWQDAVQRSCASSSEPFLVRGVVRPPAIKKKTPERSRTVPASTNTK